MIRTCFAALALSCAGTFAMAGCNSDPSACTIANGEYHAVVPDQDKPPVIVFLHGAGSNGANVMRNTGLVSGLTDRGYAVLAPTASRRFGQSDGRSWNFFPGWQGRDETTFLRDVVNDAAERFDLDETRVLLSGFSAGGFMVYYLACATPDTFSAYASVSGGFWRPHPATCKGPVHLHHTHGWTDSTVPLEGRYLAQGRFQQGDIFAGLEIWRQANDCPDQKPDGYSQTGDYLRRHWSKCAPQSSLELALFPGGHKVPSGWADMILNWFEAL